MNKLNSTLRLFCLLFLVAFTTEAYCQQAPLPYVTDRPSSFNVVSGSDYYIAVQLTGFQQQIFGACNYDHGTLYWGSAPGDYTNSYFAVPNVPVSLLGGTGPGTPYPAVYIFDQTYYVYPGPSYGYNFYMLFTQFSCCSCGSYSRSDSVGRIVSTDPIYPPVAYGYGYSVDPVPAISGAQAPTLYWRQRTDLPASMVRYDIKRNGVVVGSVTPTTSNHIDIWSWQDPAVLATGTYHYEVTTQCTNTAFNQTPSVPLSIDVPVTNDLLHATDATVYGSTQLSWPNIAAIATNDIAIYRGTRQIAVVNKNSVSYDDFGGVPGVVYDYSIAPIAANNSRPFFYHDSGSSRPNGRLSGYVRSVLGAGVPNVKLTATATVDGGLRTYIDSTDATGYYEMTDVYYDTTAAFTIVPSKGHDQFTPGSITRTISLQNYSSILPDITDTTVFSLTGTVTYAGINCPVAGAQLYVNGNNTNLATNSDGSYAYTAQMPGTYTLSFRYLGHTFDSVSRTFQVTDDVVGINFHDTQKDTLLLDLKSGCNSQICASARFHITGDIAPPCYSVDTTFDGTHPIVLVLPAMKYIVSVNSALGYGPSILGNINNLPPIPVDITHRDTVGQTAIDTSYTYTPASIDTLANDSIIYTRADTLVRIDTVLRAVAFYKVARFIYHGPISVSLHNVPTIPCLGYVVNTSQPYLAQILVKEVSVYQYPNGLIDTITCPLDTATVTISDYVSGAGQSIAQTGADGTVTYPLIPGEPHVPDASPGPHQYRKLLNIVASAGTQAANIDAWMMILGVKTLTPGFVSKAPPMPFMVLHDPPGSASYSSLEKDSSVSLNISVLGNKSFNAGGSVHANGTFNETFVTFGVITTIPGPYFTASINGTGGRSIDNNHSYNFTMTASQTISTSSDPEFVGFNGDVFIGGTLNTKYAFVYHFTLPPGSCTPHLDTVPAFGIDSIESTFIYSARHIRETLLPQLATLLQTAPDTGAANKAYFQTQILMWDSILIKDSASIVNANYTQNISFSSGVSYDYTMASDTGFQHDYQYTAAGDINTAIGVGVVGGTFDIGVEATVDASWSSSHDTTRSSDRTTTYSYHLQDDIPGNAYSVSIGKDPAFGSPIFKMFSGYSACPWEPGTQHRDQPELTITPGVVYNVPAGGQAAFAAYLDNQSESQESRTYQVSVAPESNPDGATIRVAGQDITQFPANFTIGYGHTLPVPITVTQGPFAADYNGLQISLSSACDGNISVTAPISAHFQTDCSPVSLILPNDGWLINSSNNSIMQVTFANYNQSNPNLTEIGIQYRQVGVTSGGGWSQGPTIPASQLSPLTSSFTFDPALYSLTDGHYQIRAYASCGLGQGSRTYSDALSGEIDRTGLSLYGTPMPANGVLNLGGTIGINFNTNIDCNQIYEPIQVSLVRTDNGVPVPALFTCFGNGLLITTNPPGLLDSLDGVTLRATVNRVHDQNGNAQTAPVYWSFLVNRSTVYWNSSSLNVTATTGSAAAATAAMQNAGPLDSFTIIHMPSWLTTPQSAVYLVSPGTPTTPSNLPVTFTTVAALNPGHYSDTVIALADGKRLPLYVSLDVVKPHPNWHINPADYQYSMNVTTNFSTTPLNTPLSTDTRDTIAVFKGEECRGYAGISYDAATNKYVAFITAYSNSAFGDSLTFRMWDAVPGVEYQAKERLVFISDGIIGQPLAPYILHPEGVFQTITFTPGWNWFSLYVRNANMTLNATLGQHPRFNNTVIKTFNGYSQYTVTTADPIGGWQGTINSLSTDKSYMIYLDHPDTLHILGLPVTDTSLLHIASGWNWVGYPRQQISPAASYLSTANAANGDLLKTKADFTQYNGGVWSGTLSNMYPGQGYKLKATNAFNFVIPPDRSLPAWSANEYQYQQNMTVTADLQFNGVSTTQSHYLVGAFANGICIGIAQPIFIAELGTYRVFIVAHGDTANTGQAISYRVYDTDNDIEYTPTYDALSVVPDTTVALVTAPYVINVQTSTGVNAVAFTNRYNLLQNVPNPFSKNTSIQYEIPTAQHVTLTLYDEAGRLIAELVNGNQQAGKHQVSFVQEDLQSGVYLYQMKSGDFVKTRRMLILK